MIPVDPESRAYPHAALQTRRLEAVRRRRHVRRRRLLAVVLLSLVPIFFSYTRAMLRPSSSPLGIRSVEWLRASGLAWLVNDAERVYYTWTAPAQGGPALTTLPSVGRSPAARITPSLRPRSWRATGLAARVVLPSPIQPLLRPRLPGEGIWHTTTLRPSSAPALLVTSFRPDPSYPRFVAYVAWIDHTRTQLVLNRGRYEPPWGGPRGAMQVPLGERSRLLATFNSGFTWKDGRGGFVTGGRTFEPLRSGLATLVAYRDGHLNIVSWDGAATAGRSILSARQNLPLIVARGRLTAHLSAGPEWGVTLGNAVRVWRSGVGVGRDGNLIYAAADHQTVISLARILVCAGAVRAMELDINAHWPTFDFYGRSDARDPVKLVPNSQQPATRYLVPDDRDFFAVYRRRAGAAAQAVAR